jgi:hypothetical protein
MKSSYRRPARFGVITTAQWMLIVCLLVAPLCVASGPQGKNGSAKGAVTGRYEGTAKNAAGDIITVSIELTDKDGAISGIIHSDHGDFNITSGTHKGDDVRLEFDTNGGPSGTILLKLAEDKLSGTWSAGEDGGSLEVKKAAGQEAPKEKS